MRKKHTLPALGLGEATGPDSGDWDGRRAVSPGHDVRARNIRVSGYG